MAASDTSQASSQSLGFKYPEQEVHYIKHDNFSNLERIKFQKEVSVCVLNEVQLGFKVRISKVSNKIFYHGVTIHPIRQANKQQYSTQANSNMYDFILALLHSLVTLYYLSFCPYDSR